MIEWKVKTTDGPDGNIIVTLGEDGKVRGLSRLSRLSRNGGYISFPGEKDDQLSLFVLFFSLHHGEKSYKSEKRVVK